MLATFRFDGDQCELVGGLHQLGKSGVSTGLLLTVIDAARDECDAPGLSPATTTLTRCAFSSGARCRPQGTIDQTLRIKPSFPLVEDVDIEIHDELELELLIEA